jgi:hypothetical protein
MIMLLPDDLLKTADKKLSFVLIRNLYDRSDPLQYAPYRLLLICNKFWMGGGRWGVGGGEARGLSWKGRIKGVEGWNVLTYV